MGKPLNRTTAHTTARPVGETLLELVAIGSLAVAVVGAFLWWTGGGNWLGFWDAIVLAGEGVLDELGWVIGVYVPTLLGFYLLVVGEQLSQATDAGRLRRVLGGVAESAFAALIPGLTLVAIFCLSSASVGPLLVILPASGLLLFLTVQLGAFVVFDPSVQLAEAVKAHERSSARLRTLRTRSRRRIWLVLLVNLGGLMVVACAAVSVSGAWSWLMEPITYMFAAVGALVACAWGALVAALFAERAAMSRLAGIGGVAIMWVTVSSVARILFEQRLVPLGVAVLAMAAISTLSALWPLTRSPRVLVNLTLSGGFSAVVAGLQAKAYRDTSREIRRLRLELADAADSRKPRRVSAAWAALRGS